MVLQAANHMSVSLVTKFLSDTAGALIDSGNDIQLAAPTGRSPGPPGPLGSLYSLQDLEGTSGNLLDKWILGSSPNTILVQVR